MVRTRAFNHTGPRHNDAFVTSNFARQIAEIETGKREPVILVGNLEAKRDFSDIRDIVKAYDIALEMCDYGDVYNIGSDRMFRIRDILNVLMGFTGPDIQVKEEPDRMRPSDVPALVCDSSKFREKTGWQPVIPLEKTLEDLLDYWRSKLKKA